jgi:rRNA maturation RNase YbeY
MNFFEEDINYQLANTELVRKWVTDVVSDHQKSLGECNIIFCSDKYLHELNLQYLQHDTLTDIITFDYSSESSCLEGDIFISIERVAENAESYSPSFETELHRVIIHGFLHLLGYKDKSEEEQRLMREKEDFYLMILGQNLN